MLHPIAQHPALLEAAHALQGNELAKAETLVRSRLAEAPGDVEALRLLAGVAAAVGLSADAEQLLRQTLELAPAFVPAYADLASLLCRLERVEDALALLDNVIATQSRPVWALSLKTAVLDTERHTDASLHAHEELIALAPEAAIPWMNYGHALRAVGRLDEAIAAYRKSLSLDPGNGFAWWGLANLRTIRLEAEDVVLMERALRRVGDDLHRAQLHFALGKALGDQGRFEGSFHHYEEANRIRRKLAPYDAGGTSDLARLVEAVFTAELFAQRSGQGCDAPDPIFVVGMPRSGSTLVEQILASHPMIEGAGELPELQNIAAHVSGRGRSKTSWLEAVVKMGPAELAGLGERYLSATRRHRRTNRPLFIDKMPSNWQYIGLIGLILPNAKIIDARRHPLACCFSNFSTYFSRGTSVPTSLPELAQCYRDYVRAVSHFEAALPGGIHRLQYERAVDDLEGEVRSLLAYLNLPFNEACLRFSENPRAIHTPSAAQVRRPINRDGLESWRNYEPWLTPLKKGLGALSALYPSVPHTNPRKRTHHNH